MDVPRADQKEKRKRAIYAATDCSSTRVLEEMAVMNGCGGR